MKLGVIHGEIRHSSVFNLYLENLSTQTFTDDSTEYIYNLQDMTSIKLDLNKY